ncbi:MAG: aminopeptidase [Planctomycetota bacterium]|nr:aminopeptidase [Planctomycetota bacterium]
MKQIRALPFLLLIALSLLSSGCRMGYYLKAGYGQAKIVFGKQDIATVLEDPKLDPERRRKLLLVEEIRQFAFNEVGLTENDNYTTFYDLKGKPITYTVVACRKDSLDPYIWSFPIVGDLPYIGFFDPKDAKEEALRLKKEGYDVVVWPASAYSTLGWFSDPVLSNMLDYSDVDLVDVLLHEQTHVTVYIENDITFNENLATFVGYAGSLEFFKQRGDSKNLKAAMDQKHDKIIVGQFTEQLVNEIKALYKKDMTFDKKLIEREKVFARARLRFRKTTMRKLKTKNFDYLGSRQYNNAILSTMSIYNKEIDNFEALYKTCGSDIRKTVLALKEISKAPDPKAAIKQMVEDAKPYP